MAQHQHVASAAARDALPANSEHVQGRTHVLQYNATTATPQRLQAIIDYAETHSYTIICLQETKWLPNATPVVRGWTTYAANRLPRRQASGGSAVIVHS